MPLVNLKPFKTPRRAAAGNVMQVAQTPAPVGGLNYRDPISQMRPIDALVLDNFIPRQTGVELRKGWGYTTATVNAPIKSLFAYNAPNPANNKLFAAADGRIYDVTTNPPTIAVNTTGSTTNIWQVTQFSTPGDKFLLAVSPGAGYWTYSTATGWVNRTALTVGLPTNVATVMVWKQRVWFTTADGQQVYYMRNVNEIQGHADPFPMGSVLRNGGYVAAMLNWTLDAGVGIDDHLVVIGSEGDIGVWTGTDPTSANTFGLKGVWYIGPVPRKGRFYTPTGGDVMLISEMGLVPLSRLVNGQYVEGQPGPAAKIQTVLAPIIASLKNSESWDFFPVPVDDILVIKPPKDALGTFRQFVMNVTTGSWCTFSNLPMACTATLDGQLYFGTDDGRVAKGLFGKYDGMEVGQVLGNAVQGEFLTAFNDFGSAANLKRFGMARPIFISEDAPSVQLQINTQYTFDNLPGSPTFLNSEDGLWDTARWDLARWSGATSTFQAWSGIAGLGYYGALRMKVKAFPGTIYTSSHVSFEVGGVM